MLSPKNFVVGWGQKDPLIRFRKKSLERLAISDADKEFLAQAGLPDSAAPSLSFAAPKSGELPTVADQWDQPDAFRRYRVIGSDGSGNPIAIDEERGGEVVCLDHDDAFARTFMNKSVRQLAASLLAYRNIIRELVAADGENALPDGELPPKARKQLHQELKKIDPAAMKPACFWPEETSSTEAGTGYPAKELRDLGSPDVAVRLKASNQLQRELLNAATKQRKEQFGNMNATSPLLAALDDPEPKVVHNAVVALAQIARNYFKDDRVYAKMLPLVHSKHPLTARWAVDALIQLRGEESLDDILPLASDPSPVAREAVFDRLHLWLGAARSQSIRPECQKRLQEAALRALSDDERGVRGNAASILGDVGDGAALAALRKALKKESYWLTEKCISNAIEALEGRS